jgi:ubiquinone/menaquinone biosynthesis C-methylase UbiE
MTEIPKRDFDKLADTYDQPHAVKRAQAVAKAIRRQVPLDLKMDVMDLGAGTGLVALALWPFVHSIRAVDSSREMLSVLRRKVNDLGISNVKTLFCDFESEPLPDDKWDLIYSVMTFHHVADVEALLHALRGMLKPGGVLAVADLDTEDGDFHADNTGVHHFGFDRRHMKRLFRESRFGEVKVSTAHRATKLLASGETKGFSVFLITGVRGDGQEQCADDWWL